MNYIGVIAAYQAQVGLIQEMIAQLVHDNHPPVELFNTVLVPVSKVESMQGSQKIILWDVT